jgi:hypothetical protein
MSFHIKKYLSPIFSGVALLILGLFISTHYDFYSYVVYLDKVYHVLGGMVLGWFFFRYFNGSEFRLTQLNLIFVTIAAVCFFGVIWEFAERLSSVYSPVYFPSLYQYFHGGDLNDTLLDLVADMFGGLLFVLASIHTRRGR